MKREPLDIYDKLPEDMINYLQHNGRHFNHKLCKLAVGYMQHTSSTGDHPLTKSDVDQLLKTYNITIENNILYDYVYVANMCKNDFLGSSIVDDCHMAMYIKDVIDDEDGYDGIVFNRWYADMCRKGIPIDWGEVI